MNIIELQSLSASDVDAILHALPLLFCSGFEVSDLQNDMNLVLAESLTQKLVNRQDSIDANECRVMCLAVLLAQEHLSGKRHLELDPETQSEISKRRFSYNKLAPAFSKTLDTLAQHFGY